jgi:hypothetical protein
VTKRQRIKQYKNVIDRLEQWCNAYPVDIFGDPDYSKVNQVLSEHGITLDSVPADIFRHVLQHVKEIIKPVVQ